MRRVSMIGGSGRTCYSPLLLLADPPNGIGYFGFKRNYLCPVSVESREVGATARSLAGPRGQHGRYLSRNGLMSALRP